MSLNISEHRTLDHILRALQVIFAIIVMGTDGYAIHTFRDHTVYVQYEFGNFYNYVGTPNAWGFLMFCASWTVLVALFHLIVGLKFAGRMWIGYVRIAVEAVAVLSWLAGFIAVAVQISTNDSCSRGENSCSQLTAATVVGAFEWLLFMITAALTLKVALNNSRKPETSTMEPKTSTIKPGAAV